MPRSYGSWYGGSLSRSVALGNYWTEHLKTEIEVGWTGRGQRYAEHPDASFESRTYGPALYTFSTTTIVGTQRYQFGHNAMFHPDVAVGAIVEWVHRGGESGPLYSTSGTVSSTPSADFAKRPSADTTPSCRRASRPT